MVHQRQKKKKKKKYIYISVLSTICSQRAIYRFVQAEASTWEAEIANLPRASGPRCPFCTFLTLVGSILLCCVKKKKKIFRLYSTFWPQIVFFHNKLMLHLAESTSTLCFMFFFFFFFFFKLHFCCTETAGVAFLQRMTVHSRAKLSTINGCMT